MERDTGIGAIAARLDGFMSRFEDHARRVEERFDSVEEKQDLTNGDVRRLKEWRAELRGAYRAVGWAPPVFTGIGASVVASLVTALLLGAL